MSPPSGDFVRILFEVLALVLMVTGAGYWYRSARRKGIEKKVSLIQSEHLLPKPTYLTFVPEKDIASFVPSWEKGGARSSSGHFDFDAEIKYEDEPLKRFSITHYTTALDALLAGIDPLTMLAMIDWNVVNALDFSHSVDLSNYGDLKQFVSDHMLNLASGDGWYTRLHGYVAEQVAGTTLADAGHKVWFPESSNQPGFDLIVDGRLWQVKAGADPQEIVEHLEKYPDIPVLAPPEVAAHVAGSDMVVPLPELNHDAISDSIHDTMGAIDHGDFSGGLHFPFITGLFSSYREIDLLLSDRTDIASAIRSAGLDIAGTGVGGFVGAKAGAWVGSLVGPVGSAIGAVIGGIAGALLGRSYTDTVKEEPLQKAMTAYQQVMHDNIDAEINSSRVSASDFVTKQQKQYAIELRQIEEHFRPMILDEKHKFHSRLRQFVADFDSILSQIEDELIRQKPIVLASIERSSRLRRFLWPAKQDLYYELIDRWFEGRLRFVRSRKKHFINVKGTIEPVWELRKRLEEIFTLVRKNPFRNEQFEQWLRDLEIEFRTMVQTIEVLRRKARMVTEIKRKGQTELIKEELLRTYTNLTKTLKQNKSKVKPFYAEVVKEAKKLGIDLQPL